MSDSGEPKSVSRRKHLGFRETWCCSFTSPQTPENPKKFEYVPKSFNSPSPSNKLGLARIDPRQIFSPGRVSPIHPEPPLDPLPEIAGSDGNGEVAEKSSPDRTVRSPPPPAFGGFDVRLVLKGKNGENLVLDLDDSEVLRANSSYFASMIDSCRRGFGERRIVQVGDVGNLGVFKETIELMHEKDATKCLQKKGVSRAIDILEVSSTITFEKGVTSCLNYLEAVPWSEHEEEKLKILFARYPFDGQTAKDVLSRLYLQKQLINSQDLAVQLVQSVTEGSDSSARRELKSLVKGLLSKSSVYQKDPVCLNKEDLYRICLSCLNSLAGLFKANANSAPLDQATHNEMREPLIGRISKQVDNINWLLEILIDGQMGEEFVSMWADQTDLVKLHERASPMVRYEISRVSASVFVAVGTGKVCCKGEMRYRVMRAWFKPMLEDFGWLRRCPKGLNLRGLEEALGQVILTLSLKQQENLFVEWFRCFSVQGSECPNLSHAFQVWWRRSFSRGTEG